MCVCVCTYYAKQKGNSFNRKTLQWSNANSGIGSGIDSFYEYLYKAYIMFGDNIYWDMFKEVLNY